MPFNFFSFNFAQQAVNGCTVHFWGLSGGMKRDNGFPTTAVERTRVRLLSFFFGGGRGGV